jgi:hypothetical protein
MWKNLPADKRLAAAEAFWRDDQDDSGLQHVEAIVAIAKRLKFRPKSVQALPIDRRARQLAQMPDVSDAIATRALIAYHFTEKRDLMGAFLDALGIAHDRGQINEDEVAPPERDKLMAAANAVQAAFPKDDVDLYLRTLATLDGDTWAGLNEVLSEQP